MTFSCKTLTLYDVDKVRRHTFIQYVMLAFTDASIARGRAGLAVVARPELAVVARPEIVNIPRLRQKTRQEIAPWTTFFAHARHSNDINRLELAAIFAAIIIEDPWTPLTVHSDSQTALDQIHGAKNRKYARLARMTLDLIAARPGDTTFRKVKAHSGNEGNEYADALASASHARFGGEFVLPDEYTTIHEWFRCPGSCMCVLPSNFYVDVK